MEAQQRIAAQAVKHPLETVLPFRRLSALTGDVEKLGMDKSVSRAHSGNVAAVMVGAEAMLRIAVSTVSPSSETATIPQTQLPQTQLPQTQLPQTQLLLLAKARRQLTQRVLKPVWPF